MQCRCAVEWLVRQGQSLNGLSMETLSVEEPVIMHSKMVTSGILDQCLRAASLLPAKPTCHLPRYSPENLQRSALEVSDMASL